MKEEEKKKECEDVIKEIGEKGIRDMGKWMEILKERYEGKMEFKREREIVK